MADPTSLLAFASAGTAAFGIAAAASLKGWQGWLELKRVEAGSPRAARARRLSRPDLAELRHRVRRLEAIADGR